jgi:hypothetical protein
LVAADSAKRLVEAADHQQQEIYKRERCDEDEK